MYQINFENTKTSSLLKSQYPQLNKIMQLYQSKYYRDVLINLRLTLESIVDLIFKIEALDPNYSLSPNQNHDLKNNLDYLYQQNIYPIKIINLFTEIRKVGNTAVHDLSYKPTTSQAWHCISDIHDIVSFIINTYENGNEEYITRSIYQDLTISNFGHRINHYSSTPQISNPLPHRKILLNSNKENDTQFKPRNVLIDQEFSKNNPINSKNNYSIYRNASKHQTQNKKQNPKPKGIFDNIKSIFKK